MADEINNRANEAEEANSSIVKEDKGSIVVEEDTEESEEEALVYDRASGETSEDSGSTCVEDVSVSLFVAENEHDDTVINCAPSGTVEHVQEQTEEKIRDEEKGLEESEEVKQNNNGQEVQGNGENGDKDDREKDEEEPKELEWKEDEDENKELEWKEEEAEKVTAKVITHVVEK